MNFKYFFLVFPAFWLFVSCGNKGNTAPQMLPEYPTAVVEEQDVVVQSVYPVVVKGQEDVDIKPRVDGFIDAIYVDEGAIVKKGQALFLINSPKTEQELTAAQEAVNSAQAQVNTAQLNVERIRPLAEKGIVSQVQLQTVENTYASALATLAQAQAQLKSARESKKWMTVTSPVNGVLGTISYRLGSLVNSSSVLTSVADVEQVYAYFSLNEKASMELLEQLDGDTQAEKIKHMPEVTLLLANGEEYSEKGRIETISGVVNVTTGSVNFRAKFSNKNGILRSGTSGKIVIPRNLRKVFVIPQKATFAIQDKTLVYKVEGDSVVQKVVRVLPVPGGQNYAVMSGLSREDRIVVDGVATLNNGKKITPLKNER